VERVRQRYAGRCGYCGVSEEDVGATLTADHHRPRIHGGSDLDENIVYCCPRCNEHKGSYWSETDPPHIPLLHPLRDNLASHLVEREDGHLDGRTPEGAYFIERLRLNRPLLVSYRLGQRSQINLRAEVVALRQQVSELEQRVARLGSALELAEKEIDHEGG
jgi:hypothetical protein